MNPGDCCQSWSMVPFFGLGLAPNTSSVSKIGSGKDPGASPEKHGSHIPYIRLKSGYKVLAVIIFSSIE